MATIAEVLEHARAQLARFETAGSDAAELLSRLLGARRLDLRVRGHETLEPDAAQRFADWVERRSAGEPVQYITGRAAFRSIDLAVSPAVLVPRPETEGLVEIVLEVLRDERAAWSEPHVLDLGTGSGAIALAIAAEHATAVLTATDASADALAVARANADTLGLATRVTWLHGDWFDAVDPEDRFEVVVSNPPYIATTEWDALPRDVRLHEPREALFCGSTGLEALRDIVDLAPDHLVAGGVLALELAEARAAEVEAWFDGARDWERVELREDLAGRPRVLVARRQAGPAIAPRQWPEARRG
jgi:release factor glutamine methyltransferase